MNLGSIEGFFSKPLPLWTIEERLTILSFIKRFIPGFNRYCYCPKDDPFVTTYWDRKYPQKKLEDLKKIIDFCNQNGIRFVYGINPSLSTNNMNQITLKIERKLRQIAGIGCDSFCLLFDDIPIAYDISSDFQDNKVLGQFSNQLVELVNDVYKKIDKFCSTFWLCSPDYCFTKETALTNALKDLNKSIEIIWTGNQIFTANVNQADINRVKALLGERKIVFWSNYPVNDCEQEVGQFNLGGFPNIPAGILTQFAAILVNPMREPYANFPFLLTLSSFSNSSYERNDAWNKSLNTLFGKRYLIFRAIIKEFSQPNANDKQLKFFYAELIQFKKNEQLEILLKKIKVSISAIESSEVNNKFGLLFLSSIQSIFRDATWFGSILEAVIKNKRIKLKEFIKNDRYPTKLETPFFPEIIEIVENRLVQTKYNQSEIQSKLRFFIRKYPGKKRLLITRKDKMKLLKLLKEYVLSEQKNMLSILNSAELKPLEKMRLYSLRMNVNRFTVKENLLL